MRADPATRAAALEQAKRIAAATLFGALGIFGMTALADAAGAPYESVPFVTSVVLVMAAPESPQAQPRNIFCGHVLSAAAGVAVGAFAGPSANAAALAVGLAIALMLAGRALHPPAGINAFMAVTQQAGWSFILAPVALGALLLIAFAYLCHRAGPGARWPAR
jgi:CBS-domain-containing membrane protein